MKRSRVVVKAVLVNKGKVLILKRSETDTRRPLDWDLPGGAVEDFEDFPVACAREVQEETGIEVDAKDLHLLNTETVYFQDKGNVIWLIFGGSVETSDVELSYEHSEFKWVSLNDAVQAIEYDRQKRMLQHVKDHELLN